MAEAVFLHYDEKLPEVHDPLYRHFYHPFSEVYQVLCRIRFLWPSPLSSGVWRSRAHALL